MLMVLSLLLFFLDFIDPVEDLASYFHTLQPFSAPMPPPSQLASVTPTATSWATYPPSMMDSDQSVDEFLTQIQANQKDQKLNSDTIQENQVNDSIPTKSILDNNEDHQAPMYMTSVLRKRRIKMRKHKYNKLRKRTRALRKKLGK